MLHSVGLNALATAGDMNRNVLLHRTPARTNRGCTRKPTEVGESAEHPPAARPCVCGDLARSGEGRDPLTKNRPRRLIYRVNSKPRW